jgi:DNA polymerase III delta prime subunit
MVSFIVIAKEKKKREANRVEFAKKHAIDTFDITIISKDSDTKTSTQSIGIETIKLIQKKLYFKPIKSKDKMVVIEEAQLLTPEAQNALLKVLEEPPANTFIILETETKEALLQTILSRCQIITLEEDPKKLSENTINELNQFIKALPDLPVGQRLKQAELLAKDKEKALSWIENLILVMRDELLQNYKSDNAIIIRKLQTLYTLLKTTNVNLRFAIEHTLLSL